MRPLTSKDGDLLSRFNNINDTDANTSMKNNSLNDRLINSHSVAVNRRKIGGQLPLEHIFGFCKTFRKVNKNLGFHLTFKTPELPDIMFTSIGKDINVTINSLYLLVLIIIPNTDTHVMFHESFKNTYKITYDSGYTERKLSTDGNEFHVDIGNPQQVNSPKSLIASFETADRIGAPKKKN